jgi:ubiquinone/menaquinone biosynthesis C-methylase UbiE
MTELFDGKTETVAALISEFHTKPIRNLLVVGCGSGLEAAILAQRLGARVTGIDIEENFDPAALALCELKKGDAMALEFGDEQFDFIFSYHALEHIDEPEIALSEMHRVLTPGGGFWIGTPNKERLVGYIGGKNTSFSEKVRWNILDWRMRLAGKFENRLGAHAGFTRKELGGLLRSVFATVDDRTVEYFTRIYPGKSGLIETLEKIGFSRPIYPSVYFSGSK